MKDTRAAGPLAFAKMHAAGNDFMVVDTRGAEAAPRALVRALADRRRGVGFDQYVELQAPAAGGDLGLVFLNADGSASAACGNATRCVAVREMDRTGARALHIETAGGVLVAERRAGGAVWVNMGAPHRDWGGIPLARAVDTAALPLDGATAAVGMGNPHCVFFVEDADALDPADRGPGVEHDPLFPERTNVEFVSRLPDGALRVRVWERGAGVTLACGTGACAAAVVAHLRGFAPARVAVAMDGGRLEVDWRADGVWLTGPVAHVFDGTIAAEVLEALA